MFMAFAIFIAFLLLAAFAIWGEKIMSSDDAKFLVGLLATFGSAGCLGVLLCIGAIFLVVGLVVAVFAAAVSIL